MSKNDFLWSIALRAYVDRETEKRVSGRVCVEIWEWRRLITKGCAAFEHDFYLLSWNSCYLSCLLCCRTYTRSVFKYYVSIKLCVYNAHSGCIARQSVFVVLIVVAYGHGVRNQAAGRTGHNSTLISAGRILGALRLSPACSRSSHFFFACFLIAFTRATSDALSHRRRRLCTSNGEV